MDVIVRVCSRRRRQHVGVELPNTSKCWGASSMRDKLFGLAGVAALAMGMGFAAPSTATAGSMVAYNGHHSPGTIVVSTSQRRLYYVLGNGQALVYPVGVGRMGKQWAGHTAIEGKYVRPDWMPPAEI